MREVVRAAKSPEKLRSYYAMQKPVMAGVVVFGLAFNVLAVFGPLYQGKLLDSIIESRGISAVLPLAALYLGIIALIQLCRYFKRFYVRRFANTTASSVRLTLYNNILHKSAAELAAENRGNLFSRAVSDVDIAVEGLRKLTTEIFDTGVLMAAYIVMMFVADVKIALLSIIFIPLAVFAAEMMKRVIYKYSRAYRDLSAQTADMTYDLLDNAMLYRTTGTEETARTRYNKKLEQLRAAAVKAHVFENALRPIYKTVALTGIVFALYLGGIKTINGGWTVGEFSSFAVIFTALAGKAGNTAKLINSVQKSRVSWERVKPYMTEYKAWENPPADEPPKDTALSVSALSFAYGEKNVLENVSFDGRSGQIVGVTGSVASGKSALAAALSGLYKYGGSITVNGKELREYSDAERCRLVSWLSHNPQLFSDTLKSNIALGAEADTDGVLSDVCFDEDLTAMRNGLNTLVGNGGVRLSGGQRARISLARALLNKPRIIILDDPFSAVDMKTEEQIIANLKAHYADSLIILLSHRLTAFAQTDAVLLLSKDTDPLFLPHEKLLAASADYRAVYALQQKIYGEEKGE